MRENLPTTDSGSATETPRRGGAWIVGIASALCTLCALGVVAAVVGWPISGDGFFWIDAGTKCAVALFFLQGILRKFFLKEPILPRIGKHIFETIAVLVATAAVCAESVALPKLFEIFKTTDAGALRLGYEAIAAGIVAAVMTIRGIRSRQALLAGLPLNPGRVFILSFVLLVGAGTLLLKTPNASVSGLSWCDALFLSTSAVCVTGLSPFDIAQELTFHGQCVVLTLIQLGGLGVMSITYFFAYFFAGGLSLRNRFDFRELFSEQNIGQIGTVLAVVVGFTFTAEAAGAVAIYFSTHALPVAADQPIFFAVFHSVSAFCNAGLSCVPGGLTDSALRENMAVLSTIFVMALVGGLGFPVIKNFWLFFVDRAATALRRHKVHRIPVRLSTHTKIVLTVTVALFLFGFAAFWILGACGDGNSVLRAFFLAGTSRTSGFDIAPTAEISSATKMLLMGLMFIGGSPFSTAGGIKTTTFAVAVLSLRQYVLGRRELEVFGRRLGSDVANQALAIVLLGVTAVFAVTVSLCVLHPELDFLSLAFESVSAVGTVGLSCGVTPKLGEPAKYIVAATMFVGRIGILLFTTSFLPKKKSAQTARLPETTIVMS